MYVYTVCICIKHTKSGLITDVTAYPIADKPISSGGQAAIMNQMIATPGVAYIAAANMILQANYLWLHK